MTQQNASRVDGDSDIVDARAIFRAALVHTHITRTDMKELESAAGRFCMLMRQAGNSPERTLIDAKAVIDETIDGHDATVAELAIRNCIEHYFRR